jgi:two-component system, NarL family, response regulator LiaR
MTGGIPMTEGAREGVEIRVLIVDDHDLFRTGMASLLGAQRDIKVVAQASGGRMGVRLADELQPDVVLMDLRMPDLEGPDATREILALRPQTRVLVFTVASDDADVAAALHSGACGFVAKDTSPNDVGAAIRAAAQGVAWLSPRAAEVVLRLVRTQNMQRESQPDPTEQLSARQLDVLRLIARGKGNGEIAEALGISPRTAKNHVSNILSKLGLSGRLQAAIYAVRCGLI